MCMAESAHGWGVKISLYEPHWVQYMRFCDPGRTWTYNPRLRGPMPGAKRIRVLAPKEGKPAISLCSQMQQRDTKGEQGIGISRCRLKGHFGWSRGRIFCLPPTSISTTIEGRASLGQLLHRRAPNGLVSEWAPGVGLSWGGESLFLATSSIGFAMFCRLTPLPSVFQ